MVQNYSPGCFQTLFCPFSSQQIASRVNFYFISLRFLNLLVAPLLPPLPCLPLFLFSLPIFHSRHARHDFYRAIGAKKCFTEFLRVDFFALAYVGKNNWKLFTMHIILLLLLFVLHLLFAFVLLHLQK